MLFNAKDRLLTENPGTLPNVSGAILDWFQKMTFTLVRKRTVNYNLVEDRTEILTHAMRQPLTAQQLMMKPEGERKWKWELLHALPDLVLQIDDIVIFHTVSYRVMRRWDWTEYGYVQYEICQDYAR